MTLIIKCEFCMKEIPIEERATEVMCGERWQHLGLACSSIECMSKMNRLKGMQLREADGKHG